MERSALLSTSCCIFNAVSGCKVNKGDSLSLVISGKTSVRLSLSSINFLDLLAPCWLVCEVGVRCGGLTGTRFSWFLSRIRVDVPSVAVTLFPSILTTSRGCGLNGGFVFFFLFDNNSITDFNVLRFCSFPLVKCHFLF